ncbi:MAG: LysM peptidoglycan-binding domain-containing protein [Elusimicrobia bacterium]|nr:LysM peptidoglycan-binding domain-containing protein [Elusimicrobiota bacterium]
MIKNVQCSMSNVRGLLTLNFGLRIFIVILLLILDFGLRTSDCLYAAFENQSSGARPYGMGNAFTGLADDIQAIFYNPAGITQVRHKELITYFGKPFVGLDDKSDISDGFVGYLHPLRGRESLAVSVSDFRLSTVYNENIALLSYAKEFSKRLSFGLNMKVLRLKYGSDSYTDIDPLFERNSRTSFSGDFGLFVKLSKKFYTGISAFNLNEPNIGIGETVRLPIRTRLGFGWRSKFATFCLDAEQHQDELKYFFGGEKSFFNDKFYFREGFGYGKDFTNISLGLSVLPDPLKIDYAFQLPITGVKDIIGTHRLSVVFEFGKEISDPYTKDLESEISRLEKEKAELQKKLETTEADLTNISSESAKTKIELDEIQRQKEQLEKDIRRIESRPAPKKILLHTVERGDTLASISQKYYGTSDRWQDIYNANKNKIERGMPVVGTQLVIP